MHCLHLVQTSLKKDVDLLLNLTQDSDAIVFFNEDFKDNTSFIAKLPATTQCYLLTKSRPDSEISIENRTIHPIDYAKLAQLCAHYVKSMSW